MVDGNARSESSEVTGTREIIEDILLTDAFLIKGTVEGKFSRLSMVLDQFNKKFIVVSSATMVDLKRGECIKTPRVQINIDELILAHELVDSAGDFYLQALTESNKDVRVRTFCHGIVNLEITGRIAEKAYETKDGESRFFIMEGCTVRGLDPEVSPEFALVDKLSYAIVNSAKLAYIYDFS